MSELSRPISGVDSEVVVVAEVEVEATRTDHGNTAATDPSWDSHQAVITAIQAQKTSHQPNVTYSKLLVIFVKGSRTFYSVYFLVGSNLKEIREFSMLLAYIVLPTRCNKKWHGELQGSSPGHPPSIGRALLV